jgi:hypothetical protein
MGEDKTRIGMQTQKDVGTHRHRYRWRHKYKIEV